MLRLYHDEDSGHDRLVAAFRRAGFDCLTTAEVGRRGESDLDQLAYAAETGRAILTRNVADFARLHSQWAAARRAHAGIIVNTDSRASIGRQLRGMQNLASTHDQAALVNRLEFLLNYSPRP